MLVAAQIASPFKTIIIFLKEDTMTDSIKIGDQVEWKSSQGKIVGVVKKKLIKPIMIKTHKVAASAQNPQYLVESEQTKSKAAHKKEALTKITKNKD